MSNPLGEVTGPEPLEPWEREPRKRGKTPIHIGPGESLKAAIARARQMAHETEARLLAERRAESLSVDLRRVGHHEGLLMAVSWLEAVAHEAMKRRDKWLRSSEYALADRCAEEARVAERIAQDLRYKAAYMLEPAEDGIRPQDGPQAGTAGILHCSACGGTGWSADGLEGRIACPDCSPGIM